MKSSTKDDECVAANVIDHVDLLVDERLAEHRRVEHDQIEDGDQRIAKHSETALFACVFRINDDVYKIASAREKQ